MTKVLVEDTVPDSTMRMHPTLIRPLRTYHHLARVAQLEGYI